MKFVYQAELLSMFFVSSLAFGQEPTRPTSQSSPAPLELKLTNGPMWKDNCLELRVQRTNLSKFSIFLDAMFEGIKVYSSVSDATKTVGRGPEKAWMLVYGWTDVVSDPIELAPGARRQKTLCIAETFPVKQSGKERLRQVRVQGRIRIVAGYEIAHWRIIDQPRAKWRRAYNRKAGNSNHWTLGEVVLEIPIPCPNGIATSDCVSLAQIFPDEHDVYTFELEPPEIDIQLPPPPILSINSRRPQKP